MSVNFPAIRQSVGDLLRAMSSHGYNSPDGFVVHPVWTIPDIPGRITTRNPPLHALPRGVDIRAAQGNYWVRWEWPGHCTAIAQAVTASALDITPSRGTDAALGAHFVAASEMLSLTSSEVLTAHALRQAYEAKQTPYVFKVPVPLDSSPLSAGKLTLIASGVWTEIILMRLWHAYNDAASPFHRISNVTPYLGAVAFQIDNRVPLAALCTWSSRYTLNTYNEYGVRTIDPVVSVGARLRNMMDASHPQAETFLQMESDASHPVPCSVCGRIAACQRDLNTHLQEDHPELAIDHAKQL